MTPAVSPGFLFLHKYFTPFSVNQCLNIVYLFSGCNPMGDPAVLNKHGNFYI